MAKIRTYTDVEKAEALLAVDANGGNVSLTARQLGIPGRTLATWVKGRVHPEIVKSCEAKRAPLADRLEELAHKLIDAIPGKIEKAKMQEVSVSAGIALDKMRLLRDQPTGIFADGLSDEERAARLASILERGRQARAGHAPARLDAAHLATLSGTTNGSAEQPSG